MFNNDSGRTSELVSIVKQEKDGYILKKMQEINKHYYYAYVHSNLINGLTEETEVEDFVPWWQPALKSVDIAFGVLAIASLSLTVVSGILTRKEEK